MRLAFLALALLAVPFAAANVDQCSAPVGGAPNLLIPQTAIQGATAWRDGSCGGSGVVGAPGNCTSSGQLCVGFRPVGAVVLCTWYTASVGNTVNAVAIGVDTTGDGNVYDNQDPDLGLDAVNPQPTAGSPHTFLWRVPATGDVIVYPASSKTGGSANDVTMITCL